MTKREKMALVITAVVTAFLIGASLFFHYSDLRSTGNRVSYYDMHWNRIGTYSEGIEKDAFVLFTQDNFENLTTKYKLDLYVFNGIASPIILESSVVKYEKHTTFMGLDADLDYEAPMMPHQVAKLTITVPIQNSFDLLLTYRPIDPSLKGTDRTSF